MADRDQPDPARAPGMAHGQPGDASPARAAGAGADEPRAVDVVTGRARADSLDPVTLAQLEAWFGAPAAFGDTPPHLVDAAAAAEAASLHGDPEVDERRLRVRALLEVADEALLARADAHVAAGDALTSHLPPPPVLAVEHPMTRFDLEAWNLRLGGEPREIERPPDLAELMEESTPQAVLRDLHRPVLHWNPLFMPRDVGIDVGGERTRERIASALGTRYQVRMDEQPIPRRILAETLRERRERLAEPWENAYKVREQQEKRAVPTAEDLYWFGLTPIDDDAR